MHTVALANLPAVLVARMEGARPPESFRGDGCTACPDFFGPIDCRPACLFHDWAYRLGGGARQRLEADCAFYRNLRSLGLWRPMALFMFYRVRLWGRRHFHYAAGNKPEPFWRLLFSRYVRW